MLCLLFVVNILVFTRLSGRFFRRCRAGGRLLVAPVMIPAAAVIPGTVPPVGPPLPGGVLSLRRRGLLPCLVLLRLRWLIPGIRLLRIFICHICQTE